MMHLLVDLEKLPELGLYRADWLPQTRTDSDSDDAFSGSGIQLTPIESMRRWNIEFRGKLKKVAQAEDEDVTICSAFCSFGSLPDS